MGGRGSVVGLARWNDGGNWAVSGRGCHGMSDELVGEMTRLCGHVYQQLTSHSAAVTAHDTNTDTFSSRTHISAHSHTLNI